jgi:hypothetical protein
MDVLFAEAAWLWLTKVGAIATASANAVAAINSFLITSPPACFFPVIRRFTRQIVSMSACRSRHARNKQFQSDRFPDFNAAFERAAEPHMAAAELESSM